MMAINEAYPGQAALYYNPLFEQVRTILCKLNPATERITVSLLVGKILQKNPQVQPYIAGSELSNLKGRVRRVVKDLAIARSIEIEKGINEFKGPELIVTKINI